MKDIVKFSSKIFAKFGEFLFQHTFLFYSTKLFYSNFRFFNFSTNLAHGIRSLIRLRRVLFNQGLFERKQATLDLKSTMFF